MPQTCSACGKRLHDTCAMVISLSRDPQRGSKDDKKLQHNLGRYQIDKEYAVCYECLLVSLGVHFS
jgi:hypothetical protein